MTTTWVGSKSEFVAALGSGEDAALLIVAAHGDERGLHMPDVAEALRDTLGGPLLEADEIRDLRSRLPPLVVCTASRCGSVEFARAFLARGAETYIGARDDADGNAALMYVVRFLHELGAPGATPASAAANASSTTGCGMLMQRFWMSETGLRATFER